MLFNPRATRDELRHLHEETQRQRIAVDAISPQTTDTEQLALALLALETGYMHAAEAVEAIIALPSPQIPVPASP